MLIFSKYKYIHLKISSLANSVDYNGRSSDICRAIAVYDRSLRYRSDGLASQRVHAYTHTCTLARLGLRAHVGRGLERYTVAYYVHAMATKRSASTAASTSQDSAKKAKGQVSVLTYKK